ncbi:helix-turn-helix domain-containing protein [Megasphaera sp.]|uniref:MerR family transcriptional regulator n=1 Tax=Megasphaera sp. TaxID=2023260 RepID=UPI00307A04BD
MKNLYTISETAKILSISSQTLRKYSNADLVKPQAINPETGYRYYSFEQFHIIDRIKYLRQLGMSLNDIKAILTSDNLDLLKEQLKKRKLDLQHEIKVLQDEIDDVKWYMKYFSYLDMVRLPNVPYIRYFPERYILVIDYQSEKTECENDTIERVETKIIRLKNQKNYAYRRQWGYLVDTPAYLSNQFVPKKYFIFLKHKPQDWHSEYMAIIPEGLYLCLWCPKKDQISAEMVHTFYESHPVVSDSLALEYENSLQNYKSCPYEYQTFIKKVDGQ